MWACVRLWMVIAAAIYLFPVNAVLAGAPDVCAEACDEETGAGQLPSAPGARTRQTSQEQDAEPGPPESEAMEVKQWVRRSRPTAGMGPGALEPTGTKVEDAGAPEPAELQLLPVHLHVPAPRDGIAVARGALGYRAPLVVRQRVPARILGGVYVPAHETYVVLQPGYWEAVGVVEDTPAAVDERTESSQAAKGCWLRRLFRKLGRCDGGS